MVIRSMIGDNNSRLRILVEVEATHRGNKRARPTV